jgi:tRNA pseudouridine55 synthase
MVNDPEISGMIPLLKPRGMTSKDVSRVLLKRFGRLKIGHVGTLDPEADGVLPVLIGKATKLQDYLLNLDKAYSFDLTLGRATTTMDAAGATICEMPWPQIQSVELNRIIDTFIGVIEQVPPLYSAVKYQGQELYKYAHRGRQSDDLPLEDLKRRVVIKKIAVEKLDLPVIGMTVECGKGTYIRTLATDIAAALGTVGYVTRLTRIYSAGMGLDDCLTLEQATSPSTQLEVIVINLDKLSIGLPTWRSSDKVLVQRIIDGQRVIVSSLPADVANNSSNFELLLKCSDDRSIGIVNVEPLVGGTYKLHMKRGL